MSTGAEFSSWRSRGDDVRPEERDLRVLLVEGRDELADEIRENLGRTVRASFEVVFEMDLVEAAARIGGDQFDLLLIDPMLPGVERGAVLEVANDLAHRLPVVVLTGTEGLATQACDLARCVEHADVAGKLLTAIRRSRRLGTGVHTPSFCRLEGSSRRVGAA